MDIKYNIINLCDQLNYIMTVIDAALKSQNKLNELQRDLLKHHENIKTHIPYISQEKYIDVVDKEIRCDRGWFVLFCNSCNKVCHKRCKGIKEGWQSSESGCILISQFSAKCQECGCRDTSHRFRESYLIKEKITKTRPVIRYRADEKAIQIEEQKRKIREVLNRQIEEGNRELLEINQHIHNSLRKGIDCLFQLALKNNELNNLALKKDKKKYGFMKEILEENMKDRGKSEIFNIFNDTLDNIEILCEKEEKKEQEINKNKETLLKKKQ